MPPERGSCPEQRQYGRDTDTGLGLPDARSGAAGRAPRSRSAGRNGVTVMNSIKPRGQKPAVMVKA